MDEAGAAPLLVPPVPPPPVPPGATPLVLNKTGLHPVLPVILAPVPTIADLPPSPWVPPIMPHSGPPVIPAPVPTMPKPCPISLVPPITPLVVPIMLGKIA